MTGVPEPRTVDAGFRLAVAGGGTGGHMFPGVAVAQAFLARHLRNRVIFINAGRPLETKILDRLGWPQHVIDIEGIKGRGIYGKIRASLKIPKAVWQSIRILRAFRADLVLGVGGYSAGPAVTAAWMLGIPTALHEQNQLPGLTNRLLRRIVDRIYLTFADLEDRFDKHKTLVTGNPVRDEIVILGSQGEREPTPEFRVLVIGGSQGARPINRAMTEALDLFSDPENLSVVHQTGPDDEDWVGKAYGRSAIRSTVKGFFDDMAAQYAWADVVVCRAGATTVAEITGVGRAAVMIPFPQAADDHQTRNAEALVDAGAAVLIPQDQLDGRRLVDVLGDLMAHRERLAEMADSARSLGRPEAAVTIVGDLYHLLGRRAV